MDYVYHGSKIKGLKEIKRRKSTHQKEWVYATPSKVLATIFMGNGNDLFYDLSGNGVDKPIILVERKPNMFKTIFDESGSLYYLDSKNFLSNQTNWSGEVISNYDEIVIKEEYINNVYDELIKMAQNNELQLYLYPNRPKRIPLDNSDLIPKVIDWESKGFNINRFFEIYPELKEEYYSQKDKKIK